MSEPSAVEDLASYLRELKAKTGRSYDALAKRLGISKSALHRYCSGDGVPPRFTVLEQFAKECRANQQELIELHRRWVRAQTTEAESRVARQGQERGEPEREERDAVRSRLAAAEPEDPPAVIGTRGRPTILRGSGSRTRPVQVVLTVLAVLSLTMLLVWPFESDLEEGAKTAEQASVASMTVGAHSCTIRRGVRHVDARQGGHVWSTDFVCANRPEAPLYLTVDTTEKIAILDTPKSWFVCWAFGRVQSDGGNIWYYTRGDRSEPGKESWSGWGFVGAEHVDAPVHPVSAMPGCEFVPGPSTETGKPRA
ncbi:helix-turn-helix transcriptional regulator [Streptosporangium sp. NPDC006013]|uniref:helix-turn-helix domain-containing protein n=1 Tax=Streptosporangium sp. NPDC006013 TaxID=3155596 RepID=UPI0033BAB456